MLFEDRLDALQEGDRDRAAHATAVERDDPFVAGPKQVAVAGIRGLEQIFDDASSYRKDRSRRQPQLIAGFGRRHSVPGVKWHGEAARAKGAKQRSICRTSQGLVGQSMTGSSKARAE